MRKSPNPNCSAPSIMPICVPGVSGKLDRLPPHRRVMGSLRQEIAPTPTLPRKRGRESEGEAEDGWRLNGDWPGRGEEGWDGTHRDCRNIGRGTDRRRRAAAPVSAWRRLRRAKPPFPRPTIPAFPDRHAAPARLWHDRTPGLVPQCRRHRLSLPRSPRPPRSARRDPGRLVLWRLARPRDRGALEFPHKPPRAHRLARAQIRHPRGARHRRYLCLAGRRGGAPHVQRSRPFRARLRGAR